MRESLRRQDPRAGIIAEVVEIVEAPITFPLRHVVLGRGNSPSDLAAPDDTDPDSAHLVIRQAGRVMATGTVRRRASSVGATEPEWQMRGMAVEEGLRGRGYGTQVLQAILDHVASRGGGRVWCHARVAATSLYRRHGFVEHGDPFENDAQVMMGCRVFARTANEADDLSRDRRLGLEGRPNAAILDRILSGL